MPTERVTRSKNNNTPIQSQDELQPSTPQQGYFDFEGINEDNPSIKDIFKLLKSMHHAFHFLSDVNDDFRKKIKTLEEDNKSLKVDNINLNKRILNIENVFFTQQQQQLQTSITIHGVPKQKKTLTEKTLLLILQKYLK